MEYKFYFKRKLFWNSEIVVGHHLENDVMTLFKKNGCLLTISQWHLYDMQLKEDWVLATKMNAEKETGIKLSVGG